MKNIATKDNHTKNKFKKQKRKLFSIVAVGLLVLSIAMCSIFTASIYSNHQQVLYYQTAARFNVLLRPTLTYTNVREVADYSINLNHKGESNVQVIVKYQDTGEIYSQTRNCLPRTVFSGELKDNEYEIGFIEYDNFRASMTDEQYKKISDYLLTKLDSGEKNHDLYYALFYSEFYYQGTEIIPKKLEILKVNYDNDAHKTTETPVESFELNPKHNKSTKLYKTDNILRTNIEKDFFLGKYEKTDLLSEIEGLNPIQISEHEGDLPVYFTDLFEFVLCHTEDVEIITNDGNKFIVTATYLEKVNTIESCIGEILMMCGFVFYICAIAGIIIGAVLWKAMKKQLEQEERLRTVTNSMAHQLKTPLFVIGGYAENLAENVNTNKRTHYAQVITEQTNAMNEMVCKMLDYSRLDSESFALNIERFELTEVAKEIIENYKLDNSQLECKKDVYIEADKKLIKSVVENLIDNAVKYSTDISKISIKINNNTLSVSNPYKALTNKELDDMWKPYYRSTEKEKSEGHGLGLAIVKSILDLHKFKYNAKYSDGNIIFSFEFK
ncbi:MAG: HAMP domain-containing sensor histidine kinase [Acutalibacteraceae bacterium]|nr:HAMP domain-containing sensor histidine kinase [Acutalibacteraceae bacterium]